MRRVDQQVHVLFAKKCGKPSGTAEAADTNRHGLFGRGLGAAGKREQNIVIGARRKLGGERLGFRRTSQNEDGVGQIAS